MTCPISLSKQKAEQHLSPGLLLLPLGVRLCAHLGCETREEHQELVLSLADKPIYVEQTSQTRFLCGDDKQTLLQHPLSTGTSQVLHPY